jgi:DNA-binding MarR family transcriptional regulator
MMQADDAFVKSLLDAMAVFTRGSMHGFLLQAKSNNLSMSQIGALFLMHKGSSGVRSIGEQLGITTAAASQMIDRLVQQGLADRSENPQDRRAKQIVLTGKGQQVLGDLIRARQGFLEDMASKLSAGEREQVLAAIRVLLNKAEPLAHPPDVEQCHQHLPTKGVSKI